MKKINVAMGLSLTILVALYGGGVAQAVQGNHSQNPAGVSDPIASQNPNYKGIKSPHSSRKEAAKRLKMAHLLQERLKHGGVKAKQVQNQTGASVGTNQTPANQGGV